MPFDDPLVEGEDLVRNGIQSPDYVAGVSGWRINRDGSAEFNNITLRGSINADYLVIDTPLGMTWSIGGDFELAQPDGSIMWQVRMGSDASMWVKDVNGHALVYQPVAAAGLTANSPSIGAAETVILTIPSATYPDQAVYRVDVTGGIFGSAAGNVARMRVRVGDVTGAVLADSYGKRVEGGTVVDGGWVGYFGEFNSGDGPPEGVTTPLVLTMQCGVGTVAAYSPAGASPFHVVISRVGNANGDFSGAANIPNLFPVD